MDRGYVKCHWRGSNGQQSHTAALGSLRNLSKSKVNPNGQPSPTVSSDCQRRVFGSADEIVIRLCQTLKAIPWTLAPAELFPPRRERRSGKFFLFRKLSEYEYCKNEKCPVLIRWRKEMFFGWPNNTGKNFPSCFTSKRIWSPKPSGFGSNL